MSDIIGDLITNYTSSKNQRDDNINISPDIGDNSVDNNIGDVPTDIINFVENKDNKPIEDSKKKTTKKPRAKKTEEEKQADKERKEQEKEQKKQMKDLEKDIKQKNKETAEEIDLVKKHKYIKTIVKFQQDEDLWAIISLGGYKKSSTAMLKKKSETKLKEIITEYQIMLNDRCTTGVFDQIMEKGLRGYESLTSRFLNTKGVSDVLLQDPDFIISFKEWKALHGSGINLSPEKRMLINLLYTTSRVIEYNNSNGIKSRNVIEIQNEVSKNVIEITNKSKVNNEVQILDEKEENERLKNQYGIRK